MAIMKESLHMKFIALYMRFGIFGRIIQNMLSLYKSYFKTYLIKPTRRDGCPNGETIQQVATRCDHMIAKIMAHHNEVIICSFTFIYLLIIIIKISSFNNKAYGQQSQFTRW